MELIAQLPTHGARSVDSFCYLGARYLVITQLASDVTNQPPSMTLGNSDTQTLVYCWNKVSKQFLLHQQLPAHGGEDSEHFQIGERLFIAVAHLRSGQNPYNLRTESAIYELNGDCFKPFQYIETCAAKQWKFGQVEGRYFLALAQGVALPGEPTAPSLIYEWNGQQFIPFQEVESAWGYNWLFFEIAGQHFLAYADHVAPSRILKWDGQRFANFQQLEGKTGRAFCHFKHQDQDWLSFACLHDNSVMFRWDEKQFAFHQILSDTGGREFEWVPQTESSASGALVQINFIRGTRDAPEPVMSSFVYRLSENNHWEVIEEFQTSGGTDACSFANDGQTFLAVTNSLSPAIRFATPTHIYRI